MKAFDYYQPTEIKFGWGRVEEIGEVVSRFGKRCLMVTVPCLRSISSIVIANASDIRQAE